MISNTRRVFTVAKVAIDEFDCAIDVSEIGSPPLVEGKVCMYTGVRDY